MQDVTNICETGFDLDKYLSKLPVELSIIMKKYHIINIFRIYVIKKYANHTIFKDKLLFRHIFADQVITPNINDDSLEETGMLMEVNEEYHTVKLNRKFYIICECVKIKMETANTFLCESAKSEIDKTRMFLCKLTNNLFEEIEYNLIFIGTLRKVSETLYEYV